MVNNIYKINKTTKKLKKKKERKNTKTQVATSSTIHKHRTYALCATACRSCLLHQISTTDTYIHHISLLYFGAMAYHNKIGATGAITLTYNTTCIVFC